MTSLPSFLKIMFWDTDFDKLEILKNPHYIIKRVLDRGDTNAIKWLLKTFSKNQIVNTVTTSQEISRKTATFWASFYNIDRSKILCLQKPYTPTQWGLSS